MKDQYRAVGSWGTLGLEIVVSVVACFFGGRWLDERFGTEPWLQIAGFFLGCGAGGNAIHRTWKEMSAVTAREEREQGNPSPVYDDVEADAAPPLADRASRRRRRSPDRSSQGRSGEGESGDR